MSWTLINHDKLIYDNDDSGNYSIVHNIAMEAMVSVRCPL